MKTSIKHGVKKSVADVGGMKVPVATSNPLQRGGKGK